MLYMAKQERKISASVNGVPSPTRGLYRFKDVLLEFAPKTVEKKKKN